MFKRREKRKLLVFLIASSFFVFGSVYGANSDIVINEIAAYPTSTHEWIEVWNKGTTTADFLGWKFWEGGVAHSCAASSTDSMINPGEYAVIVQNEEQFKRDYPGFSGSIFDSSWGSLNETGEEIGLVDNTGTTTEIFTYIKTNNASLERKNPFMNEYTTVNWQEHVSSNTVGFINTNFSTTSVSSTPEIPTSTPDMVFLWSQLRINEFVPDPQTGDEWVEIFNPSTTSLKLDGGVVCDNREEAVCIIARPTGTIAAQGWTVFSVLGNKLNNSGDTVVLKNPSSTVVDTATYGGSTLPKDGQAFARMIDGTGEWRITTVPTPGVTNTIVSPPLPPPPPVPVVVTVPDNHQSADDDSGWSYTNNAPILINELLPNPVGADIEGEFIELKNTTQEVVKIDNWKIRNSTKSYVLSGSIEPGGFEVISRTDSGIVLKNSGEEKIRLINPNNLVADEVRYKDAPEDKSYNRISKDVWMWSVYVSEGEENIISTTTPKQEQKETQFSSTSSLKKSDDDNFVWNVQMPDVVTAGEQIQLGVVGSYDMRGGEPMFIWSMSGGAQVIGETVSYVFPTSGIFQIVVSVSTTAGTISQKQLQFLVQDDGRGGESVVIVSEVFPAPQSKQGEEFVEILNRGIDAVDISGWIMQVDKEKKFIVPTSTFLEPGARRVFYKPVTKISLGNKGFLLELFDNTGHKMDELALKDTEEGKSYSMIGDGWYWDVPSPYKFFLVPASTSTSVVKSPVDASVEKKQAQPKSTSRKNTIKKSTVSVVEGIVTVPPGIFSSQYFYIATKDGGVQVYQSKKDFPSLEAGDKVSVVGKWSTVQNTKRILLTNKEAIDILDTEQIVEPTKMMIKNMKTAPVGALVRISGQITELKTTNMYIDDGEEVLVVFKKGAEIDKKTIKEGGEVEVVGIVEHTAKGLQILPRSTEDIVSVENTQLGATKNAVEQNSLSYPYTKLTFGGVGAMLLGWVARSRGLVVFGALKGVGKRIRSLFGRKTDQP